MPLAEVCCSISENFRVVYTNETGESSIEATPACGGVKVDETAILPVPHSSEGRLGFERNRRGVIIPDARFGDKIHNPMQRSGSR